MYQQRLYEYQCLCVCIYERIFSAVPVVGRSLEYLKGMGGLWSVPKCGRRYNIVRR